MQKFIIKHAATKYKNEQTLKLKSIKVCAPINRRDSSFKYYTHCISRRRKLDCDKVASIQVGFAAKSFTLPRKKSSVGRSLNNINFLCNI